MKLLKRYTPYKLRKTAEALILSKIDYVSFVYQKVQKFLIKRLQKVQTISAGYVLNRYAKECDVIKLGWLPITELHLEIMMITNYSTLKIKTHLNMMFTDVLMICH